jgi:hypothetical protein
MDKFLKFMVAIAVLCGVLTFAGVGWLVFKGVEGAGAAASVVEKEGVKGLATRLWCGTHGCK